MLYSGSDEAAMTGKTYVLHVAFEQDEDGRWSAWVPGLTGCSTWGYTKEEARSNLQEEARMFIDVLLEHGEALPEGIILAIDGIRHDASGQIDGDTYFVLHGAGED